jgi:RNA polymerase sigma-70 factor, ECF subfamily
VRPHADEDELTKEATMANSLEPRELADHTRYLRAYALRKLSDLALAEDLVQDTLLAACASGTRYEGRSSVRTWLTGILKHKIADTFRSRARAPLLSLDEMREHDGEPLEWAIVAQGEQFDFGGDPEKQLEHKRFWDAFMHELGRMPARTADAFVLSEFTDAATGDICERLGVSAGALWVMRCRTRSALRAALAPALAA